VRHHKRRRLRHHIDKIPGADRNRLPGFCIPLAEGIAYDLYYTIRGLAPLDLEDLFQLALTGYWLYCRDKPKHYCRLRMRGYVLDQVRKVYRTKGGSHERKDGVLELLPASVLTELPKAENTRDETEQEELLFGSYDNECDPGTLVDLKRVVDWLRDNYGEDVAAVFVAGGNKSDLAEAIYGKRDSGLGTYRHRKILEKLFAEFPGLFRRSKDKRGYRCLPEPGGNGAENKKNKREAGTC